MGREIERELKERKKEREIEKERLRKNDLGRKREGERERE
jgi:hypothetical protein